MIFYLEFARIIAVGNIKQKIKFTLSNPAFADLQGEDSTG